MSRNNQKRFGILALSLATLASCSTTKIKYPDDYNDDLFANVVSFVKDNHVDDVVQNNKEQYYKTVLTGDALYREVVNQLLLAVSKKAAVDSEGKSKNVAQIMFDADQKTGIYGNENAVKKDGFSNLEARAKQSLETTARGGSYTTDNLFKEDKFVLSLRENFTLGNGTTEQKVGNEIMVTPFMSYDDIYKNSTSDFYNYYLHHSLYQDMQVNYLTAEYIYQKAYSSIVNSVARRVQIVALADRSDNGAIGSASKVVNAYVRDYVKGDKAGKDKDFSVISRIWKGLTVKTIANTDPDFAGSLNFTNDGTNYHFTWAEDASEDAKNYLVNLFARYGVTLKADGSVAFEDTSVIIRPDEEKWMIENNLIDQENTADDNCTLAGKVVKDQEKVIEGLNAGNLNAVDTSLESTYTGSYTYDVGTGFRKAYDDIAINNLITDGIQTKSGLTSLPDTLKDRVFSTDIATDKTTVEAMKTNVDEKTDGVTLFEKDGFRYVTNPGSISTEDDNGNIVFYDASSKTYYLTRILDVVSSTDLNKGVEDSSMYTVDQKELLARQVAYALAPTGDYKTNASVYWLRRIDMKYSDDDFLEYMKSNYKDLFKTESTVDKEAKISLSTEDFKDVLDSLN